MIERSRHVRKIAVIPSAARNLAHRESHVLLGFQGFPIGQDPSLALRMTFAVMSQLSWKKGTLEQRGREPFFVVTATTRYHGSFAEASAECF
jgi:hypothetical protein